MLLVGAAMAALMLAMAGAALAEVKDCTDGFFCDGTSEADTLNGTESPDAISGGGGGDTINGNGGDDSMRNKLGYIAYLEGEEGDDIFGGPGNDDLFGHEGNDLLDGGDGKDVIDASSLEGEDTLANGGGSFGGAGNDTIKAADGLADDIDCGTGKRDKVIFDKGTDTVAKNCEIRKRM